MVFIDLEVDFENAMYFDEVRDATVVCLKNKRFYWHHFSILYDLFFKIDVFFGLVTRCRRKFCSQWRADFVDAEEFDRRT
jgi:hypothetical protein